RRGERGTRHPRQGRGRAGGDGRVVRGRGDGRGRGGGLTHGRNRANGEGAPRSDRRGRDGLQGGTPGRQGRPGGRRRVPQEEGTRAGGQASASRGPRGRHRDVRPPRRQARSADRGELRV